MVLGAPALTPSAVHPCAAELPANGALTAACGTVPVMEIKAFTPLHPELRFGTISVLTTLIAEELSSAGPVGEIRSAAAEMGGSFGLAPYGAGLLWTLSILDDVWQELVRRFVDHLVDPRPAELSASAVEQVERETALARLDHQAVAAAEVRTMLYGGSGVASQAVPTAEELWAAAELLDGRSLAEMFDLGGTLLAAVGRVAPDLSGPVLDRAAATLRAAAVDAGPPSSSVGRLPSSAGQHHVLHIGGGDTACIRLAWPAPRRADPEHAPLFIASHLLGGAYRNRLMRRFRSELQWSYSPWSLLSHEPVHSLLEINVEVPAEQHEAALALIAGEVAAMAATPISEEELHKGISSAAGTMALAIGSQSGMAASLIHGLVLGLPASWLWSWPADLAEVRADQVRAAAARWLRPESGVGVTLLPE